MANSPYFLVTNRGRTKGDFNDKRVDVLSYFTAPPEADPTQLAEWKELSASEFEKQLTALAAQFPILPDDQNSRQKHLSLFVHGYNNSWQDSVERYSKLKRDLFDQPDLGVPILFSWPSNGSPAGYLPDREDARNSGPQTAELFVRLHDIVAAQQ
ncbi:MAG TPA: alpha/beta hydrolase, partial [Burkholderiales bacterium]